GPEAFVDLDAGVCFLGIPFPPGGVLLDDTKFILTFDPDTCDATLTCKGEVEVDISSAWVAEGFLCGVGSDDYGFYGFTNVSHAKVSPSGRVKLTCHVNSCPDP
ncbi:hypothetical protein, partial [Hydrogenophaga sp.]|uniref:hypothetical protein n=1 Tax=Hydrogenophaga sp. TaxID=1904254 RepID=UPI0025C18944